MAGAQAGVSQLVLLLGVAGHLLLSLALTVLLGRELGADDFGFFSLVAAGFVFAREATDLGSSAVVAREIVRRPADECRLVEGLLGWRTLLGLLLGAVVLVLALQQSDAQRRVLLLAMAACVCAIGPTAFQAVFHARQRQLAPTLSTLLGQLALLVACLAALQAGPLGGAPVALLVIKEALLLVALLLLGLRLMPNRPRLRLDGAALRGTLALVGVWALTALCRHLMGQVELFSVAVWRSAAEVGALAAALRPLAPALLLPWLLTAALVPVLATAAFDDAARGQALLVHALMLALGMGTIAGAAAGALAPDLVTLLYGGRYDAPASLAASALRWQAWSIAPVAVVAVASAALLAWRRERWSLFSVAAALVLKWIACAAWVPRAGIEAATQVGLAVELLLALALCAGLRRELRAAWCRAEHGPGLGWALAGAVAVGLAAVSLADAAAVWRVAGVVGVAAVAFAVLWKSRVGAAYLQALGAAETRA